MIQPTPVYQFKAISRPAKKQVDFVREQLRKNYSGHRMNPEQLMEMELEDRMRKAYWKNLTVGGLFPQKLSDAIVSYKCNNGSSNYLETSSRTISNYLETSSYPSPQKSMTQLPLQYYEPIK